VPKAGRAWCGKSGGSQSEQQWAIRSVLDDLEQGEGENEGFWLKVGLQ
jgi:hypothetical protein